MPADPAEPGSLALRRLRRAGRWALLIAAVWLAWPLGGHPSTSVILPASSPSIALCSILATRTAGALTLLALPILLLAFLSPRWFCRHGCPTGLLQEVAGGLRRTAPGRPRREPEIGKWFVALTIGGACLGFPIFLWMDPLALLSGFLNAWRRPVSAAGLLAGSGLPLLLLLALVRPRFWCRSLCPLGATQDLLGRIRRLFPWIRRRDLREEPATPAIGGRALARRLFLGGCAGAAGACILKAARDGGKPPLRPPGSLDEHRLAGACIRCGNCSGACPSGIIGPDLGGSGVAGLLTPRLRFEDDYCREDCHRCGQVCPSGAIARLPLEEKRRRTIGPAEVDRETCLLASGRECTACIRFCPYEAIVAHSTDGGFTDAPRVEASRCTGCGACEAVCPVRPLRAIRIAPRPGILPLSRDRS